MASKMGPVIRDIREAVIKAANRMDADFPDLPVRHSRQLAKMRRMIQDRDRFDGGPNSGRPDAPSHRPGDTPGGNGPNGGRPDAPSNRPGDTPAGVDPYDGPNRSRNKGEYGEWVTDRYMSERGFERISHRDGPNGIDGIYANRNGDVMIVESKYNTSRLGWASDGAGGRNRQMDDGWLTGHYHNHDENRIRDAIRDEDLADAVEELFENGDVPPVVFNVAPDGSGSVSLPSFNPGGSIAGNTPFDF